MSRTLLLADDSVTIQRVIELTFATEDIKVISVGDGAKAIERLQSERPDIVLADANMPERDGYEVSAYVRQRRDLDGIPVILLTGAFEPVDEGRVKAAGCDAVLSKPFEPHAVIDKVRELLEHGRPLRGDAGEPGAADDVRELSEPSEPTPVGEAQAAAEPPPEAVMTSAIAPPLEQPPADAESSAAEPLDAEPTPHARVEPIPPAAAGFEPPPPPAIAPEPEPISVAPQRSEPAPAAPARIESRAPAALRPEPVASDEQDELRPPPAPRPSLDDYFDRLDAAIAETQPVGAPVVAEAPAPPSRRDTLAYAGRTDEDAGYWQPLPGTTAYGPTASSWTPSSEPTAPASAGRTPAPRPSLGDSSQPVHRASPPLQEGRATLADAFSTLLATEQGRSSAVVTPIATAADAALPESELVERVANRVIERLTDRAVREMVGDVLMRVAERLVREELHRVSEHKAS